MVSQSVPSPVISTASPGLTSRRFPRLQMVKDLIWACPQCRTGMIHGKSVVLGYWHCPACAFDWVSGEALAAFLPTTKAFDKLRTAAARGAPAPRSLTCPSCRAESLRVVKAGGVEIDVCRKCVSVALDPGELRALKAMGYGPIRRTVDILDAADAIAAILTLLS